MITLNGLNISPECWEWICKQTTMYSFAGIHFYYKEYEETYNLNNIMMHQEILHDIIYQAIDGINAGGEWIIAQDDKIIKVQDAVYGRWTNFIEIDNIKYDYTKARLASLQWIWQQGINIKPITDRKG